MLLQTRPLIRPAGPKDLQKLANLIHFETYVHRHLDYRPPLDWVGEQPFLILEVNETTQAALACPADPPEVAWIRLFAAATRSIMERAWELCWEESLKQIQKQPEIQWAAAIPIQPWFETLIKNDHFEHTHDIVMLSWEGPLLPARPRNQEVNIRPLLPEDLPAVQVIDRLAFPVIWQNSLRYLELAYGQAAIATVAELDGMPVGYQISTSTPLGGHLARLAVSPEMQGGGIGYALLYDLLAKFRERGARTVTVNTQRDNIVSLNLYHKVGFISTGEQYPVYQLDPKI